MPLQQRWGMHFGLWTHPHSLLTSLFQNAQQCLVGKHGPLVSATEAPDDLQPGLDQVMEALAGLAPGSMGRQTS